MKVFLSLISALSLCVSCAHTRAPLQERTPAQDLNNASSSLNPVFLAPEDITVWSLQALARAGRADVLNDLFNKSGLNLQRLPEGYAAGTGLRVFDFGTPLFTKLMDDFTGPDWRGAIFFPSENFKKTTGLNRIKQTMGLKTTVTPMARFVVQLWDSHPLAPEAKSTVVTLNYAQPVTKNFWQELALTQIEICNVMVAVPGKYGPVFIGKTWLGTYGKDHSFRPLNSGQVVSWFFLDFNSPALSVQMQEHWDGAKENLLQPLPRLTEAKMPF